MEYPDADTTWEELAEMAKATSIRDENGVPQSLGIASSFITTILFQLSMHMEDQCWVI